MSLTTVLVILGQLILLVFGMIVWFVSTLWLLLLVSMGATLIQDLWREFKPEEDLEPELRCLLDNSICGAHECPWDYIEGEDFMECPELARITEEEVHNVRD